MIGLIGDHGSSRIGQAVFGKLFNQMWMWI